MRQRASGPTRASKTASGSSISVGRKHRAEPRWLLPLICKAGNVTKREIGSIRILDTESRFEIVADRADGFAAAVRQGTGEKGVVIQRVEGGGAPERPAGAWTKKPHRKGPSAHAPKPGHDGPPKTGPRKNSSRRSPAQSHNCRRAARSDVAADSRKLLPRSARRSFGLCPRGRRQLSSNRHRPQVYLPGGNAGGFARTATDVSGRPVTRDRSARSAGEPAMRKLLVRQQPLPFLPLPQCPSPPPRSTSGTVKAYRQGADADARRRSTYVLPKVFKNPGLKRRRSRSTGRAQGPSAGHGQVTLGFRAPVSERLPRK